MHAHRAALVSILLISLTALDASAQVYSGWQRGPWEKFDRDEGIQVFTNEEPPRALASTRSASTSSSMDLSRISSSSASIMIAHPSSRLCANTRS